MNLGQIIDNFVRNLQSSVSRAAVKGAIKLRNTAFNKNKGKTASEKFKEEAKDVVSTTAEGLNDVLISFVKGVTPDKVEKVVEKSAKKTIEKIVSKSKPLVEPSVAYVKEKTKPVQDFYTQNVDKATRDYIAGATTLLIGGFALSPIGLSSRANSVVKSLQKAKTIDEVKKVIQKEPDILPVYDNETLSKLVKANTRKDVVNVIDEVWRKKVPESYKTDLDKYSNLRDFDVASSVSERKIAMRPIEVAEADLRIRSNNLVLDRLEQLKTAIKEKKDFIKQIEKRTPNQYIFNKSQIKINDNLPATSMSLFAKKLNLAAKQIANTSNINVIKQILKSKLNVKLNNKRELDLLKKTNDINKVLNVLNKNKDISLYKKQIEGLEKIANYKSKTHIKNALKRYFNIDLPEPAVFVKSRKPQDVYRQIKKLDNEIRNVRSIIDDISKIKSKKAILKKLDKLGVYAFDPDRYVKYKDANSIIKALRDDIDKMENVIELAKQSLVSQFDDLLQKYKINIDELLQGSSLKNSIKEVEKLIKADIKDAQKYLYESTVYYEKRKELLRDIYGISHIDERTGLVDVKDYHFLDVDKVLSKYKDFGGLADFEVLPNLPLKDVAFIEFTHGKPTSLLLRDSYEQILSKYSNQTIQRYEKKTFLQKIKHEYTTGFMIPEVYFDLRGLKETFYLPLRKAEELSIYMRMNYINRLLKNSDVFKRDNLMPLRVKFNLNKDEKELLTKYFAKRQGYDVEAPNYEQLPDKVRIVVDELDEIFNELAPVLKDIASTEGIDLKLIKQYAPIYTKKDIEILETNPVDLVLKNDTTIAEVAFKSKHKRKKIGDDIKFEDLFELDYEKVFNIYLSQATRYIQVQPVGHQLKNVFKYLSNKNVLNVYDQDYIAEYLNRVMGNKKISYIEAKANAVKGMIGVYVLGAKLTTILKQIITPIISFVMEQRKIKFKSDVFEKLKITDKEIASVLERLPDADLQGIDDKISQIMLYGISRFDKALFSGSLKDFADSKYNMLKSLGIKFDDQLLHSIVDTAVRDVERYYAGVTYSQMPKVYANTLGGLMFMFTKPLNSQFWAIFYRMVKRAGISRANEVAKALSAFVVAAYIEQSIQHLSFDWGSKEDMIEDVVFSLISSIPGVGSFAYPIEGAYKVAIGEKSKFILNDTGIAYVDILSDIFYTIPSIFRILYAIGSGDDDVKEKDVINIAKTTGFFVKIPEQIFDYVVGSKILLSGQVTFNVGQSERVLKLSTADRLRSLVLGKYGSLAMVDYIRNLGLPKDKRHFYIPEVEFLIADDDLNRFKLLKQMDKKTGKFYFEQLPDKTKRNIKKIAIAEKYGKQVKTKEMLKYLYNTNGIPTTGITKDEFMKYQIMTIGLEDEEVYYYFNDLMKLVRKVKDNGKQDQEQIEELYSKLTNKLELLGYKSNAFKKYIQDKLHVYYANYLAKDYIENLSDDINPDEFIKSQPIYLRNKVKQQLKRYGVKL